MDTLSGLLDGPRASGGFVLRVLLDPPWSMLIQDEAPLTLMAVTSGSAWMIPGDGSPVQLNPGDIALARGPEHYVVADDPATPPQVVIHPGQACTTIDGEDLRDRMGLGVRTWGNSEDGATKMLVGTYESQTEVGARLLSALPRHAVLDREEHHTPLVEILAEELVNDGPGQAVILNRLLDLLVISTARAIFDRTDGGAPGWYSAHADPIVGPALKLVHEAPDQPWTVADLASEVGVSRAAFARRFTDVVGEPPMAFLTSWRISVGADLLRSSDTTIAAVASQVGYSTPYAFSTAFKRLKGVSPSEYRNRPEKTADPAAVPA
jgi:AraC-like DNA-binding protein